MIHGDLTPNNLLVNYIGPNFKQKININNTIYYLETNGYNYKISDTETNYGYITVASTRIDITTNKITKGMADFILEKQLRNIGKILEKFIKVKISQPHYDALLYHFFYEGVTTIENSSIITLINAKDWYTITDEIQKNITKNGKVDEKLAQQRTKTAKIFSFVPGFS